MYFYTTLLVYQAQLSRGQSANDINSNTANSSKQQEGSSKSSALSKKQPLKSKLSIASGISIGLKHNTEFVLKTVYREGEETPKLIPEANYRSKMVKLLIDPHSSTAARVSIVM